MSFLTRLRAAGQRVARFLGKSSEVASEQNRAGCDAAVFDGRWFLQAYPDVKAAIDKRLAADPEDYFRRFGVQERKKPNRFFSEKLYLRSNPDVEAAIAAGRYETGFLHFVRAGQQEGRCCSPMPVDEGWYCKEHPEVLDLLNEGKIASVNDHYLVEGCLLGWDPHDAFSERWYLEDRPEVVEHVKQGRYLCGYQHLLEEGLDLGLPPHPFFDEADYRVRHPDVDEMISLGKIESGYWHLIEKGLLQGRSWKRDVYLETLRRTTERLAGIRLDEFLASDRRIDLTPTGKPELSVLLVLFNRAELTLQCLRSLLLEQEVNLEVVIIDNCSTDRTCELLSRIDGARILHNPENIGFTLAANQAAEAATADYLLFLNNDTEILPASLHAALERIRSHTNVGAVGGRILRLDGFLQEAGCIVWNNGRPTGYGGGGDPRNGAYLFPREVDYCSAVFLLVATGVFREIGGFDARFAPGFFEDVDLCFRLRQRGLAIFYEPDVQVVHFGSASFASDLSSNRLLERNRTLLVDLHRETLAHAFAERRLNLVAASHRGECTGRILWIDDRVPLPRYGSGCSRIREILSVLSDLGYRTTFICTAGEQVDRREIRDQLPYPGIEFITDLDINGLAEFWWGRSASTDIVVISRPHNLLHIQARRIDFDGKPLIYDAEALISSRVALRREVLGQDDARDVGISRQEELAIASRADEVWVVNKKEALAFSESCGRVTVVGPALKTVDSGRVFEERSGILFVGRLQEEWSPNVDGLSWFLQSVYPLLNEILGEKLPMTVVGETGSVCLPQPEAVRFLGTVLDLGELYQTSRIFVAPARFSAGIPWKVCEAAAHGLPVVASSDLVEQLGWQDELDILDGGRNDPALFARRSAELLTQRPLWQNVRDKALKRIRDENSMDRLRSVIDVSLSQYVSKH